MKFRMVNLGYRSTPDYPYDYRIELVEYDTSEREQLGLWLKEQNIPHTTAGWNTGSVIYIREREVTLFALRWA
jgi:hypothetical protein